MELTLYLANSLGFSETQELSLKYLVSQVKGLASEDVKLNLIEPFARAKPELDINYLQNLPSYLEREFYLNSFNQTIGRLNIEGLEECDAVLAILDGDDIGVASEVGYFVGYHKNTRPVFALRTDLRGGENIATPTNLQVEAFVKATNKPIYTSINSWLDAIGEWLGEL